MTSRQGCSDLEKLILQKNERALVAQDTIAKACAAIDPEAMHRTACDAQKELESK